LTRREFIALAAAGTLALPATAPGGFAYPQAPLTAQGVVDRIRQNSGVEWRPDTVDTFKAGDPATVVSGIATTAMATLGVLRQAVQSGANFIITCEPTFYSRADTATPSGARRGAAPPAPDPVFNAKNAFIKSNGLVIWRFSDHWRQLPADPLATGLGDALGWSKFRSAGTPSRAVIPATSLEELAADMNRKLNARGGIRVVGDPRLPVQRIGLLPGTTAIQAALKLLPEVDTLVAGEVREWETVEYVRDKVTAGERKSLILVGRVVSEDPGMNVCAAWLRTLVPQTRITWIPAGDPYWRPV
jgi:putative NIF3 family GTP cyclohydrolase 1 type 2